MARKDAKESKAAPTEVNLNRVFYGNKKLGECLKGMITIANESIAKVTCINSLTRTETPTYEDIGYTDFFDGCPIIREGSSSAVVDVTNMLLNRTTVMSGDDEIFSELPQTTGRTGMSAIDVLPIVTADHNGIMSPELLALVQGALQRTGGTITGSLTVNGNITGAKEVSAMSDARLKEIQGVIGNALGKIRKLRGVYFNWRDDEDAERKIGFIAQELMQVIPELVTLDTEKNLYKVNYNGMTAVLCNAIKELDELIREIRLEQIEIKRRLK